MGDDLKKTLPRIRTYAEDFEHDRQQSGVPLSNQGGEPATTAPPEDRKLAAPNTISISDATNKKAQEDASLTHVPAFHELQKAAAPHAAPVVTHTPTDAAPLPSTPKPATTAKAQAATETPTVKVRLSKTPPKPQSSPAPTARILSDNRRNHQSFIPALIASIKQWFSSYKAASKQKKIPKYTVVETERRKGVIQRATSKTGTIFTADSETLKEEIRRRNLVHPKTEASDPDITWSPNTETGYALLETAHFEPTKINVEFKKRTTPEPVITGPVVPPPMLTQVPVAEPQVVVPPPVIVEPTVVPLPEEPIEVVNPPAAIEVPAAPPTPTVTIRQPQKPPAPEPDTNTQTDTPYKLTTPEAHYSIRSIGDVTKINTNVLSLGVVGVIASIFIVIVVGKTMYDMMSPSTPTLFVEEVTPLILSDVTDISLGNETREELLEALLEQEVETTGNTEFRFLDSEGTQLPPSVTMSLIGFTNGGLQHSVTKIHVTVINGERGLVLTVTDPTAAFGALLSNEGQLLAALSDILELSEPDSPAVITDETIGTTDTRTFTNDDIPVLVYGFVDANTILITKSTTAFATALQTAP